MSTGATVLCVIGFAIAVMLVIVLTSAPETTAADLAPIGYKSDLDRVFKFYMNQQVCDVKGRSGKIVGRSLVQNEGRDDYKEYLIRLDKDGIVVIQERDLYDQHSSISRCGND